MICARCNRPMLTPAATIGRHAFGPKCAKVMGYVMPKVPRFRASVALPEQVDPRQMALQLEVA